MQTVPGFDLFEPTDVLVLGVGNILWADEGFGVRAVEAFNARYKLPERTKVADGGTLGMYLLELIGATKDLLLFDCADLQEKPGTLKLLTGDEVKFWSATKISPHQTGMNEVLALAELQGHAPGRIAVVAIQPEILQDYGGSLPPAKRRSIKPSKWPKTCSRTGVMPLRFVPKEKRFPLWAMRH